MAGPKLQERFLQWYVIQNPGRLPKINGQRVVQVVDNLDRFPDLTLILGDGSAVPAEVEWASSDFIAHDHPIDVIRDRNGVVLVVTEDRDLGLGVRQITLDIDQFETWFTKNAASLIRLTTEDIRHPPPRTFPKLWFTYISLKGGGDKDFEEQALSEGVWGIPDRRAGGATNAIQRIQKRDLIAFIGPGKGFPGRIAKEAWTKRSFKGSFDLARVHRVKRGYYFDEVRRIWEGRGIHKGEMFPHRFDFDPKPLFKLSNILVRRLTHGAKVELHRMVFTNLAEGSPSTLLEIIYHGEHL